MKLKEGVGIFCFWGLVILAGIWIYPRMSVWTLTKDGYCWYEEESVDKSDREIVYNPTCYYVFIDDKRFKYSDEDGEMNGTWTLDAYNDEIILHIPQENSEPRVLELTYNMRRMSGPLHCQLNGTTSDGEDWTSTIWRRKCD